MPLIGSRLKITRHNHVQVGYLPVHDCGMLFLTAYQEISLDLAYLVVPTVGTTRQAKSRDISWNLKLGGRGVCLIIRFYVVVHNREHE